MAADRSCEQVYGAGRRPFPDNTTRDAAENHLFNFWNTTTTDHFYLQVDGVGFGLINQPDIII